MTDRTILDPDLTDQDRRLAAAVETHAAELVEQWAVPGLNAALARRGKVIWEGAFGYSDLAGHEPMTTSSVTRSGSMGKAYTATAVMQLVEQGTLELHGDINRYLPFRVTNPKGQREITVYDLLTHQPGLTSNDASSRLDHPLPLREHLESSYPKAFNDEYAGSFSPKWSAKVGERFEYSNIGMATLGLLVEETNPEGLSFPDFVQSHIIDPLGMTSTQLPAVQDPPHVRKEILDRVTTGYAGFGSTLIPTPRVYFADYPAGNVLTIPRDHIRLLLAYLNEGELDGARILEPATVRQMLTPQVEGKLHGTTDVTVGLMWLLVEPGTTKGWFGHGGAHMYGWHNDFRAYPQLDLAIAVHTNRWDLTPRAKHPSVLLGEFASDWLANDIAQRHPDRPPQTAEWKRSYLTGVLMADFVQAQLGVERRLTDSELAAMVEGATVLRNGPALDKDAFRKGLYDFVTGCDGFTYAEVQRWMSKEFCLDREELALLHQEMGGTGIVALPLPPLAN